MTEISRDIFKAAVLHAAHAPEDMSDEELICSVLKHVATLIIAEAVADERERCARIAETCFYMVDVSELLEMTKQDCSKRACHEVAAAIRASKE